MLLPVGTIYHGTGKHHSIGKVQEVQRAILPNGRKNGNHTRLLLKPRKSASPLPLKRRGLRRTPAVNEQNPQAIGFYLRMGFEMVGRSAVDSLGKPYPLLHMRVRRNLSPS